MLINIPVKCYDSRSNTFELHATQVENCKIFTKSRAITLKILKIFRQKYPGAQLHMLINIPVTFHDSGKYFLSYVRHKSGRTEGLNLNARH
jgi:hypothetical protein